MAFTIAGGVMHRLLEENRPALLAHFRALSINDRRLRFGSSMSDRLLVRYVDGMDLVNGAAFGVYCSGTLLCAVAHVALANDAAELGVSVLDGYRSQGYGTGLFTRAMTWTRNRGVSMMHMHYLSNNAVVMHIAHKAGMHVAISRGEANAHLAMQPATAATVAAEWGHNAMAALHAIVGRLRRTSSCVRSSRDELSHPKVNA